MEPSKRVKLSLRVVKEKKTLDTDTNVSDCIENEASKLEVGGLERSLKPIGNKLKGQSSSSQNQHNLEIIFYPRRNVGQQLTTWTPLPDLQWNELDNSLQVVEESTENQTRKKHENFSNGYSHVPKNEWIPLPMPCLRCLCGRSPSSKFTHSAADKSDSVPTKTSTLVVDNSKNDTRKVYSTLPDILFNPETLSSVNTKPVAMDISSASCNTKSETNSLETSESHLPVGRGSEVDSRKGLDIGHTNRFPFHRADQPSRPNDSRKLLQKTHSQASNTPLFIPKAKSTLMVHEDPITNTEISTSISTPSGKLRIPTNKVSSHHVPNPPAWNSKNNGGSPLEHQSLCSDTSTSTTCETLSTKGQESNNTLSLQQCPLCAVQFESSLGQIERDAHIASCLSAAEEDVAW